MDITKALIKYFSLYQVPNTIIFDRGTEFNNNLVKDLLKNYKVNIHVTCVNNPKSNGLIERFHSTLIEHLRILNQRPDARNYETLPKIQLAVIAYNNSLNLNNKFTPLEVLFGSDKDKNVLKFQNPNEDCLQDYKSKLQLINDQINNKIKAEKNKRFLKQKSKIDNIQDLKLDNVLIKEGPRRIQKIRKPLFKVHKVERFNPKLGRLTVSNKRTHKIDKIKRKRLFTDVPGREQKH